MDVPLSAWDYGMREAWIQAMQDLAAGVGWATVIMILIVGPLILVSCPVIRRRRLWCTLNHRDAEVEVEALGIPGLRWAPTVRTCSLFDPPTAVACDRPCLDLDGRCSTGRRRQLPPPAGENRRTVCSFAS